jgi:hypothetical protein
MSTFSQQAPEHDDLLKMDSGRSFPIWTTTIDELPDDDSWLLELESPSVYLTLKVSDRSIGQQAATGRFGDAAVSLRRDNEDFIRCFLVFTTAESLTLLISLDASSIKALAEALNNI